jgi:hypothetical protein
MVLPSELIDYRKVFNGKRNSSRAKVYIVLNATGFSPTREILSWLSGVSMEYLNRALTKWHRCRPAFITKRAAQRKGNLCYVYGLATRGEKFLNKIPADRYRQYVEELNEHWRKIGLGRRLEY